MRRGQALTRARRTPAPRRSARRCSPLPSCPDRPPPKRVARRPPRRRPPRPRRPRRPRSVGRLGLALREGRRQPLFALRRQPIVVRGSVAPYVAGQTRDGQLLPRRTQGGAERREPCSPQRAARGSSASPSPAATPGCLQARAAHDATAAAGRLRRQRSERPLRRPDLGPGARRTVGAPAAVRARRLHYAVPLTGVLRRRHRAGADRLPQDDRPRTDRLRGQAGVRAAGAPARGQLPRALPARRPPRRGRT